MNLYYFCFNKNIPLSILKTKQHSKESLVTTEQLFIEKQNWRINKVFTLESTSYDKAIDWITNIWLPKVQGFWFKQDSLFKSSKDSENSYTKYTTKSGVHYIANKDIKLKQCNKYDSDDILVDVISIAKCTKTFCLSGQTFDACKWLIK